MNATEHPAAISPGHSPPAAFPVHRLGERLALVAAGHRLDEPRARAFARRVLSLTEDGVRELVLDLSSVREHAWPAVYALCELEAHLTEACCELVAAAGSRSLIQDLRAVGLDQAWALSTSSDAALADILARPC